MRKLVSDYALDSVIFVGDDTTDMDAITALNEMHADGLVRGLGIAVVQEDSPPRLLEVAQYSLDGVPEVAEMLRRIDSARR